MNELVFDADDHRLFVDAIKTKLTEIIKNDPLLSDLDSNLTLDELRQLLSFEHGESMKLFIRRADEQVFHVIVKLDCTLRQLRESIETKFRAGNTRVGVNWKHVWRNYGLMFGEEKLVDGDKQLRDYGVQNKAELRFYRKVHSNKSNKNKKRHQERQNY